MAVTFPDNPVLNESYQAENGLTYVWDGEKWSSQGSYNIDNDNYIRKDGTNTVVYADQLGMGVGADVADDVIGVGAGVGAGVGIRFGADLSDVSLASMGMLVLMSLMLCCWRY